MTSREATMLQVLRVAFAALERVAESNRTDTVRDALRSVSDEIAHQEEHERGTQ